MNSDVSAMKVDPAFRSKKQELLGCGVSGLGVGEQHARAFVANGACHLRWLYDLDKEKALRLSQILNVGKIADTYDNILNDPNVGLISIASYDDAHYDQVTAALKARKHVFVEKPLCRSLEELILIKKAWRQSEGRHLASNLVLRSVPLYHWLKRAIESNEFGEIYAFDGDYLYGRIHKITEGWRKDVDNYSVMQGGGIHLVDLMLWLTGQLPKQVTTLGNRICTQSTAFRYKDYVSATYSFPSGLVGRITANFGCVHRHQHVVRIFGTKATFIYDDKGPRLFESRNPAIAPRAISLAPLPATKGDLLPEFVHSILSGNDAGVQTQHEFDLISVCIAADKALQESESREVIYI